MNEGIARRIQKILSKTEEAGCTPQEAEAAFAMATRLLAEHNLTMDDVDTATAQKATEYVEQDAFDMARWSRELVMAVKIVQKHCFVTGCFWHSRKKLVFFGEATNVESARFMLTSLMEASQRLWASYRIRNAMGKSERTIYLIGLMAGFGSKMDDERKAMEAERDAMSQKGTGTALALQSVMDLTLAAFKAKNPDTRNHRPFCSPLAGARSTYNDGFQEGRRLNLNKGIDPNKRRALS
jgi:hypothetical protein